jgi:C-terminal processing protease CtpA/Prc
LLQINGQSTVNMSHDDVVKALQASNEVKLKLRRVDIDAADVLPPSTDKDQATGDTVAAMLLDAAAASEDEDEDEDVRVVTLSRAAGQRLGMTLLNVVDVPYPIVHQVLDGGLVQQTGQVYGNDVILKVSYM